MVNGSTCGILAVICAAVPKGAKVLVARNCHKSVYHALDLREARPIYIYPAQTDVGIAGQIDVGEVKAILMREQGAGRGKAQQPGYMQRDSDDLHGSDGIAAVIITSPTYDGVVSDVAVLAQAAHSYGIPLIVDAAHGAHFGFSGRFPENPLKLGADAVVVSIHKTLPAFTQTALLHLMGTGIDAGRVEEFLDIFETSSPSYVLMAGMDRCIRMMASDGRRLLDRLGTRLDDFYRKMSALKVLYVPGKDAFGCEYDDSKILIFTDRAGVSGTWLADTLRKEYNLEVEMACINYVLALATLMDKQEGFDRLSDALLAIDAGLAAIRDRKYGNTSQEREHGAHWAQPAVSWQEDLRRRIPMCCRQADPAMSISAAREAVRVPVTSEAARGQISASYIIPYPPGIPLAVPGERIDAQMIAYINRCLTVGITVEGIKDKNTIMVVRPEGVRYN
ncbi:MAG: ornithine decarboxylase [Clostridiales bacterium]|nr:ornithine decarboxylase [Clostridiales bacterium]